LPGAGSVRDPDGGSAHIPYRKDRIACRKGADVLKSHKLKQTSATNRVAATLIILVGVRSQPATEVA
jgi:hypothetical protein